MIAVVALIVQDRRLALELLALYVGVMLLFVRWCNSHTKDLTITHVVLDDDERDIQDLAEMLQSTFPGSYWVKYEREIMAHIYDWMDDDE
jgi:hypothetical protein